MSPRGRTCHLWQGTLLDAEAFCCIESWMSQQQNKNTGSKGARKLDVYVIHDY